MYDKMTNGDEFIAVCPCMQFDGINDKLFPASVFTVAVLPSIVGSEFGRLRFEGRLVNQFLTQNAHLHFPDSTVQRAII